MSDCGGEALKGITAFDSSTLAPIPFTQPAPVFVTLSTISTIVTVVSDSSGQPQSNKLTFQVPSSPTTTTTMSLATPVLSAPIPRSITEMQEEEGENVPLAEYGVTLSGAHHQKV